MSGYSHIFSAPSGETMRQTLKTFEVQERARGPFHPPPGWPKTLRFFVCLSVFLFVTLLNVRDCAADFAMKALEYRNDFDAVGRFVVVQSCSTLSDCCQLATTLNAEVQETAKIGGFRQQRATE